MGKEATATAKAGEKDTATAKAGEKDTDTPTEADHAEIFGWSAIFIT